MSKAFVMAGWDDVPHLTEESKQEMLEATPPHLRESRSKGIPGLGAGAVYPVPEDDIKYTLTEIPPWFRRSYGMDVGWKFTAVVFGAYDADNDISYIYDAYKRSHAEPEIHAAAIKNRYPKGLIIPGVIDPAAGQRSQIDGENLLQLYRKLGLRLSNADHAVDSGVTRVWSRLSTKNLLIASHLADWFEEYRLYRRTIEGKIVKEHDHYMDATRYYIMSGLKVAKPVLIKEIKGVGGRHYF